MRDSDDRANAAAKFHPAGLDSDGETREHPCIEIGGAQVYAYVEDGVLKVSVDLETADEQVFDLYEDGGVPVAVEVGGDDPVRFALPGQGA
jgi:hypothetical protein